jgi:D-alanyl-D-alanine dipeptidase
VAGNEGQVSDDRHSALIQFSPKGNYDKAVSYIDTITGSVATLQQAKKDDPWWVYNIGEWWHFEHRLAWIRKYVQQ